MENRLNSIKITTDYKGHVIIAFDRRNKGEREYRLENHQEREYWLEKFFENGYRNYGIIEYLLAGAWFSITLYRD